MRICREISMAEYSVRYSTYGAYSLIIIGLFLYGFMYIFCRKINIDSTIFFVCFLSFLEQGGGFERGGDEVLPYVE